MRPSARTSTHPAASPRSPRSPSYTPTHPPLSKLLHAARRCRQLDGCAPNAVCSGAQVPRSLIARIRLAAAREGCSHWLAPGAERALGARVRRGVCCSDERAEAALYFQMVGATAGEGSARHEGSNAGASLPGRSAAASQPWRTRRGPRAAATATAVVRQSHSARSGKSPLPQSHAAKAGALNAKRRVALVTEKQRRNQRMFVSTLARKSTSEAGVRQPILL